MSEPNLPDESGDTLPPLRIHHLLAWMAVYSVVMAVGLSLWQVSKVSLPESTLQEINTWIAISATVEWLTLATSLAILIFGIAWRHAGLSFPSEPGHWITFYLVCVGVNLYGMHIFMLLCRVLSLTSGTYRAGSIGIGILFRGVALCLWIIAYRREQVLIWRMGWAAMAVYSVLSIILYLLFAMVTLQSFLNSDSWVNQEINWTSPSDLLPYFGMQDELILYFVALVFLILAITTDISTGKLRHWSHLAVSIMLCVKLLVFIAYQYGVIYYHA